MIIAAIPYAHFHIHMHVVGDGDHYAAHNCEWDLASENAAAFSANGMDDV